MTTTDDNTTTPAVPADLDAELAAFNEHATSLVEDDSAAVQERILRNLLTAQTAHDILTAGSAMPASEVYGVPITVTGIRASESEFTEGGDHYLHVDAVIKSNGDQVTFSCGARDVCTKLVRLDQKGFLPVDVVIDKAAKPTKDGFFPVFIRPIDDQDRAF